ncbi:hypothetical protein AX14_009359 [Amanita brunnescens Koide BX004]|nr:hypothetical protein AX14_009359 [Amanita brunnescens Koide BX004]
MVKYNFSSLFLTLTAATLVSAYSPRLVNIQSVTTGLYISNVDPLGAKVTTTSDSGEGLAIMSASNGLTIQGKAGLFINPGPGNTYLIWDQIPFEWSRDSIPMGDPGAFLMAAGFGSEVLIWYDAPSPNDGYISLGNAGEGYGFISS